MTSHLDPRKKMVSRDECDMSNRFSWEPCLPSVWSSCTGPHVFWTEGNRVGVFAPSGIVCCHTSLRPRLFFFLFFSPCRSPLCDICNVVRCPNERKMRKICRSPTLLKACRGANAKSPRSSSLGASAGLLCWPG